VGERRVSGSRGRSGRMARAITHLHMPRMLLLKTAEPVKYSSANAAWQPRYLRGDEKRAQRSEARKQVSWERRDIAGRGGGSRQPASAADGLLGRRRTLSTLTLARTP
jgi:hypothetical protein